jgi:serine/threonine-protein kinase
MATVYLARMRRPMGFSRLVAIKCMHPQFAKDPSFVSMFLDEARLTARLRHPNVVPTLDIVAEDGHLLLVMEYIEGTSLASLLRSVNKAGTRIPIPIACAIIHDMLLGLHEAHQAKDDEGAPLAIIHRDVSPQNVLVGLDGLSRVLDFGVARARQNTHLSNDNEIKGKIPYMPPEQLFGEAIDHKVDVYAAGVSLWEALVCERLFDGPSETALVKKISEDPIERPSNRLGELPPELDEIVMRALSRQPGDRFESALAMAEAIASIIPLPTRTEVSAWVRPFITPREVPSSSKLPPPAPDDPATEIVAILQ